MPPLADVLKAVGPNASIIFAAWIFMGFLQQRYDNAITRFRESVAQYRSDDPSGERRQALKDQVMTFQQRCRLMGWATLTGLSAAILLILGLILGALDVMIPKSPVVTGAGIATTIAGFVLVIVSAGIVIVEGRIVHRQLHDELRDIPDLADEPGRGASLRTRPSEH